MYSLLNSLKIQKNNNSFLFQHLPVGLGTTIGNCLRRILIENLYGIAI
jgi:DNA-directed RNA polymerase alpha subunit